MAKVVALLGDEGMVPEVATGLVGHEVHFVDSIEALLAATELQRFDGMLITCCQPAAPRGRGVGYGGLYREALGPNFDGHIVGIACGNGCQRGFDAAMINNSSNPFQAAQLLHGMLLAPA
jgi:hypothetical protein